ncbi:MAG: phenylalanine-4-hydroxylase [Solirubrobacteraceae bacterium]|jgi:phenylalanine-4-hydroxylase|nr:phenylalanine-4-hydroxylase [Solirubrobacteraceae bacterium]
MFEEGQLYSPVTEHDDGSVTVHLAPSHPGVDDPVYLGRRGEIAKAALDWTPGTPAPAIAYTDEENAVWQTVCRELQLKHRTLAHSAYRDAWDAVALPTDRVPNLDEVSDRVATRTGFRFVPAPGLVPLEQFYGSLADRVFHSTQYLRHPSQPLYTPEPDLVHEVIGHGIALAAPPFAELHRLTGAAARRLETREALDFLAKVFWFTCEFGVIEEDGELRCYGAGLLSSYGEIDEFRHAEVRPLDFLEMGTAEYDITHYQPILYRADSLEHLMDAVGGFFAAVDDDTPARLERDAHEHRLGV